MKIQEMRPGVLHLTKKGEFATDRDFFDAAVREQQNEPPETPTPIIFSELEQPRWSVVSFERREARELTYVEAVALLDDLDTKGVTGLCLVTNEVADRLKN